MLTMKFLIVLFPLVALTMGQRPTYAGSSPKGYPELASRFRDPADDQNSTDVNVGIGNRLGEGDDQSPQNLPTDARGDISLVTRLNQWPRENRPFWLLNADHIEKQRHPDNNRNNQQQNQQTDTLGNQQGQIVGNQQGNTDGQAGQVQSRFGESRGSETRTIKPTIQRGSFVGSRT